MIAAKGITTALISLEESPGLTSIPTPGDDRPNVQTADPELLHPSTLARIRPLHGLVSPFPAGDRTEEG
jgi:hypothetical protein